MIINIVAIGLIYLISTLFHGPIISKLFMYSSVVFICLGLLFFLGTTVGVLRFPDFYTRMHAAGKGDTLSSMLILFGSALYILSGDHIDYATILLAIKLLIIMNFIFIGSPTATHAIMNAGAKMKVEHWKNKGKS